MVLLGGTRGDSRQLQGVGGLPGRGERHWRKCPESKLSEVVSRSPGAVGDLHPAVAQGQLARLQSAAKALGSVAPAEDGPGARPPLLVKKLLKFGRG